MSTHPNVMLILELIPDDLPNRTFLAILSDQGKDTEDPSFEIRGAGAYHCFLMQDDYVEGYQVSGKTGSIVLMDMVTYGYGEAITFADLEGRKKALEAWAVEALQKYKCSSYEIRVGANYW